MIASGSFLFVIPFTYKGDYNEKEAAISRNLLIFVAPELGLEPRTL